MVGWYVLLTGVFLLPLLQGLDARVPHLRRDPPLQASILANLSDNLLALRLDRLFDGTFFYPARDVLVLSDAQIGLQPIALPLRLLTNDALFNLNLLVVATFPITAIAADLLARLFTGSRAAGLVAGTIFAFSAYRFTHIVHLNLLSTWTLPLSYYLLERTLRSGSWRWGIAWAVSLALAASLALHYCLFLVLSQPVYVALRVLLSRDRRAAFRRALALAVPALVGGAAVFAIALPYIRLSEEGYGRTLDETWQFSARLGDYLVPAADSTAMHWLFAALRPLTGPDERELSPGFLALALAAAGPIYAALRRRGEWLRAAVPWLVVGVGAFVLSLGPYLWPNQAGINAPPGQFTPLPYLLLSRVLPLSGLRTPARFAILVLLAVAMLAALTVAAVERRLLADLPAGFSRRLPARVRGGLPGRPVGRVAFAGLLAVALAIEYSVSVTLVPVAWGASRPPVYDWLRAAPPGPAVELPTNMVANPTYSLYSTYDGHPRLNGWSGFTPAVSAAVNPDNVTAADVPSWLADCRRLGARYLILHSDHVDRGVTAAVERAASEGTLRPIVTFGRDEVFAFP